MCLVCGTLSPPDRAIEVAIVIEITKTLIALSVEMFKWSSETLSAENSLINLIRRCLVN